MTQMRRQEMVYPEQNSVECIMQADQCEIHGSPGLFQKTRLQAKTDLYCFVRFRVARIGYSSRPEKWRCMIRYEIKY